MNTIVIVTDAAAVIVQNKNLITAFLRGKGWDMWHWFDDLWIIADAPITAIDLGREIEEIAPSIIFGQFLIIQFGDSPGYYGRARHEVWAWITKHWGVSFTGTTTPPLIQPPPAE